MVFAAEGIYRIEPFGHLGQTGRVHVDSVPLGFELIGQVLQFQIDAREPFFEALRLGILFREAGERPHHALNPRIDTPFERPVVGRQHPRTIVQPLSNLLGVGQQVLFRFELFDLTGSQFQSQQLVKLELEVIPLFGRLLLGLQGLGILRSTAVQLFIQPSVLRHYGSLPRHGIHQLRLETRRPEQQRLVLGVYIHQTVGHRPQHRERHRHIVNKSPTFARCRHHPAHRNLILPLQVVLVPNGLQRFAVSTHLEHRLHDTRNGAVPNHRRIGPRSAQEGERPQQNRFPGSGLPGDDVQPREELDVEMLDDGVVLYFEFP